jgi:glycosyltransferase involved in cell wall biosynthesis
MVSGCPVGAAKVSSLPEVGGDAVLYFDPNDTQDMQKVLQRLLTDKQLRAQLREKGLQRAQLFSWTHAAKATLELFEEIVEGVPRTL